MMQEEHGEIPIVDFYSRPGCHLCEFALIGLKKLKRVVSMQLNEYNIDKDDDLTEEFGLMIPVIKINGVIVQCGNIELNSVKLLLLKGLEYSG